MQVNEIIPQSYEGREQAFIKHTILEKYLGQLTSILSVSADNTLYFTYIDCFAGPWQDDTEAIENTSIAISLRVLRKCADSAESRGFKIKIKAIYIEKDELAFKRLDKYLLENTPRGIESIAIEGDFVSLINTLLEKITPKEFGFFFIDPKNWMPVKINTLKPLLVRPKSEFVINFMYDFINRHAGMENYSEDVEQLLGEKMVLDKNASASDKELKILSTYRKNLQKTIPIPENLKYRNRTSYIKILDPKINRTKYHLIYISSHPKGITKFMETCESSNELQKLVRAHVRDVKKAEKTGISDLFSSETPFIGNAQDHSLENIIDNYWLKELTLQEKSINETEIADVIEKYNWFPSEIQNSFKRLIGLGKIENLDIKGSRRTKFVNYDGNGERVRLVSIQKAK